MKYVIDTINPLTKKQHKKALKAISKAMEKEPLAGSTISWVVQEHPLNVPITCPEKG